MNYVCYWGELDQACEIECPEIHSGSPNFIHNDIYGDVNYLFTPNDECNSSDLQPPATNYANQTFHIPGLDVTQNGYVDLFTYEPNTYIGYREYICQKLVSPILNNQTVSISFWVSLGDISTVATNLDIGFYNNLSTAVANPYPELNINLQHRLQLLGL